MLPATYTWGWYGASSVLGPVAAMHEISNERVPLIIAIPIHSSAALPFFITYHLTFIDYYS
jgi:hypothetical protein